MKLLQNGRAPGPDGISNELLKYAAGTLSEPFAELIDTIFEQHIALEKVLGKGILVALPKPGTTRSTHQPPPNSAIEQCAQDCIHHHSAVHLPQGWCIHRSQSIAKQLQRREKFADIVWAQRMLISVVLTRHWDFHKMGTDMSRAFYTINREKILDALTWAGCEADDLRLVHILLAGTNITVRVRSSWSAWFRTTIVSPQGDSLSLVMFTCYLAAALRCVWDCAGRPDPPNHLRGHATRMGICWWVPWLTATNSLHTIGRMEPSSKRV